MIISLERVIRWVGDDGKPVQRAADFMDEMVRQMNLSTILRGAGTPETNVTANPTQLYMDEGASAGSILYIKQSGTAKTGWKLV